AGGPWPFTSPGWCWVAWVWVALAVGVPVVFLASSSALGRVEPSWEDAARLAGAGRAQAWRQLGWPVVRPDVARALGFVFAGALLEPGGPLVLGLRRTLGAQIAASALAVPGAGQLTRAAVLALAGAGLAAAGRVLIRWWGGSPTGGIGSGNGRDPSARGAAA